MGQVAVRLEQSATIEEKQNALTAVLQSNTFARADQLKSFLKFVCEMEIAGRGFELSEYLIGVEALGRPQSYSPGDDSAVRNRAFALRKKLQEYYEHENPAATLRIELTKGSYCPHFVANHPLIKEESEPLLTESLIISEPEKLIVSTPGKNSFLKSSFTWLSLSLLGAALLAVGAVIFVRSKTVEKPLHSTIPVILSEAWGPILAPNADVLICIANPPGFSVHPQVQGSPSVKPVDALVFDQTNPGTKSQLINALRSRYPTIPETDLALTVTTNATYWGDTFGAIIALKTAFVAGNVPQVFPEKVISKPMMRHRNLIMFGASEYSPAIAHFLEKCPLTVDYMQAIVAQESGKPRTMLYEAKRDQKNWLVNAYGLITVLPSESSTENQQRTIIFSGTGSAGTQAATEYFASPEHLQNLKKQLQKDGFSNFPPAYQVVIKAEIEDNILLNFKYETYRIISKYHGE